MRMIALVLCCFCLMIAGCGGMTGRKKLSSRTESFERKNRPDGQSGRKKKRPAKKTGRKKKGGKKKPPEPEPDCPIEQQAGLRPFDTFPGTGEVVDGGRIGWIAVYYRAPLDQRALEIELKETLTGLAVETNGTRWENLTDDPDNPLVTFRTTIWSMNPNTEYTAIVRPKTAGLACHSWSFRTGPALAQP